MDEFKSNEDRLERLEWAANNTAEIIAGMFKFISGQNEQQLDMIRLFVIYKEDLISMNRFLASQPIFGDAKARQPLLDLISKMEKDFDILAAKVRDLKTMPPPSPPSPPPSNPLRGL
jgi:hypothetical protein